MKKISTLLTVTITLNTWASATSISSFTPALTFTINEDGNQYCYKNTTPPEFLFEIHGSDLTPQMSLTPIYFTLGLSVILGLAYKILTLHKRVKALEAGNERLVIENQKPFKEKQELEVDNSQLAVENDELYFENAKLSNDLFLARQAITSLNQQVSNLSSLTTHLHHWLWYYQNYFNPTDTPPTVYVGV